MLTNDYRRFYRQALILTLLLLIVSSAHAQKNNGTPVLWERINIPEQNLYWGPGGKDGMPDTSRISFIKEEKGGYSKKYRIKDASGRTWVAKIGSEAQSETTSVRLLAALGYKTEINYLIPRLTIPGKGTFSNVRLEARASDLTRGNQWKSGKSPF